MKGGRLEIIDIEGGRDWLAFPEQSGEGGEERARVFFAEGVQVNNFEHCRGGETDGRLDDVEVGGGGEGGEGLEDLPAAGAVGGALGEEKSNVGP